MGKGTMFGKNSEPPEIKAGIRLSLFHADDIYEYFKYDDLDELRELWWECKEQHEELSDISPHLLGDKLEDCIQSWHFLMGITAIFKNFFEWDWYHSQPSISKSYQLNL
jgi:hypothetical protein